jgi:hypothetical protein
MVTDPAGQEEKKCTTLKDPRIPFIISQLARYGDAIGKEFTLVSDRMTWLVISNSFMFASFNSAAVNYANAGNMQPLAITMMLFMPYLGLAMAFYVIPALDAAHKAAERLKNERDALEARLPEELRITTISSKPPFWIPRILVALWLFLLVVAMWRLFVA